MTDFTDIHATGKTGIFLAKSQQHADRNGQSFTVLGAVDPATYDASQVGPLWCIRFADGVEINAWPEVVETTLKMQISQDDRIAALQIVCDAERAMLEIAERSGNSAAVSINRKRLQDAVGRLSKVQARLVSRDAGLIADVPNEPLKKSYRVDVRGGGDLDVSPSIAIFEVDEALARDIVKFAALVKANSVYKIERFDYRASFLQYDPETQAEDAEAVGDENYVRTDCDCLVVTDEDFFFRSYVKHSDVGIECEAQSISQLAQHFGLRFGESVSPQEISDRVAQSLPATEGYEKGYRDALESLTLALAAKLDASTLTDALTTALDAYANNVDDEQTADRYERPSI